LLYVEESEEEYGLADPGASMIVGYGEAYSADSAPIEREIKTLASDKIRFGLDYVRQGNFGVQFSGWAVCTDSEAQTAFWYLALSSERGEVSYYLLKLRYERSDISEIFGKPEGTITGFNVEYILPKQVSGNFTVTVCAQIGAEYLRAMSAVRAVMTAGGYLMEETSGL